MSYTPIDCTQREKEKVKTKTILMNNSYKIASFRLRGFMLLFYHNMQACRKLTNEIISLPFKKNTFEPVKYPMHVRLWL